MQIVLVHEFYRQPGGEDQVFATEGELLESQGHQVHRYTVSNDSVDKLGRLKLAGKTLWNSERYSELRLLFRDLRPEVVHVHNTLPLLSPAVYYAAKAEGAAVVQTLHNYRLACVNGLFFRDGQACEDCLGRFVPWPGAVHACYRGSRAASGMVAAMLAFHKLRRTYQEMVDVYVALTEFSKQKFVEAGLTTGKIVVKPNFLDPDPGCGAGDGGYALFVGRLSQEKGLDTLLEAWQKFGGLVPLKIVGDGPLAAEVERTAKELGNIEWLGQRQPREVYDLMGEAEILVFPSKCYETFGRVTVEAFSKGTPVVASNTGAVAEIVEPKHTGLLFAPGDAADLSAQVAWVLEHRAELASMRRSARATYEAKYTAEANYRQLMAIYELAINNNRSQAGVAG